MPVYTSRSCVCCDKEFIYTWVPGGAEVNDARAEKYLRRCFPLRNVRSFFTHGMRRKPYNLPTQLCRKCLKKLVDIGARIDWALYRAALDKKVKK